MATQVAFFFRTHDYTRGEGFQIIMWTCVTEALTKRITLPFPARYTTHIIFDQYTDLTTLEHNFGARMLYNTCLAPHFCSLPVVHCGCQQKLMDTNSFKSVRTCSAEQEECARRHQHTCTECSHHGAPGTQTFLRQATCIPSAGTLSHRSCFLLFRNSLTWWNCCLQGCRGLCAMQKHRRCLWHCPWSAQALELMCNLRSQNRDEQ